MGHQRGRGAPRHNFNAIQHGLTQAKLLPAQRPPVAELTSLGRTLAELEFACRASDHLEWVLQAYSDPEEEISENALDTFELQSRRWSNRRRKIMLTWLQMLARYARFLLKPPGFRRDLPPWKTDSWVRHLPESEVQDRLDGGRFVLNALGRFVQILMRRIESYCAMEKEIEFHKPSLAMVHDLDTCMALLDSRARLKPDLEPFQRHLSFLAQEQALIEQAEEKWGPDAAKVVADPHSRNKIIGILNLIAEFGRLDRAERQRRFRN